MVEVHDREGPGGALASDRVLAQVLRTMDDAAVVCDREGTIAVWNAAAERLFGWTAAEAVGQSLDLVVPEKHRPAHWEGYRRVVATGETKYAGELLSVPAVHRDGSRRSIAFTVNLVTDASDEVIGLAAVIRDQTEAFEERRWLQRRVRELEEGAGATGPAS